MDAAQEAQIEPLFQNAISSLRMGIQDYEANDSERYISAARNYYAGLILLAKQCLLNVAPDIDQELVLGVNFEPIIGENNEFEFSVRGNRTIDLHQLKTRFKSFGLKFPEGNLDRLQRIRNNLEHSHFDEGREVVNSVIAETFPIVAGLFDLLEEDPFEFLNDAWHIMLKQADLFNSKLAQCHKSFSNVHWLNDIPAYEGFECPSCNSPLIQQEDKENIYPQEIRARCLACSHIADGRELIISMVSTAYKTDEYLVVKDGEEQAVCDCPECYEPTYVKNEINGCFLCGEKVEGNCKRCQAPLVADDLDYDNHGLCNYCGHMTAKNE